MIGEANSHYRILERLGGGSRGIVFPKSEYLEAQFRRTS